MADMADMADMAGMDGGVPTAALGRLVFVDGDGQLAVNDIGGPPRTSFRII
jgi:hypothetical protein